MGAATREPKWMLSALGSSTTTKRASLGLSRGAMAAKEE